MTLKYISDLHWYDIYSEEWREHLGLSLEGFVEMSVDRWNSSCEADDVITVVGDIGHECSHTINALKSLKGHKILVMGNHDMKWSKSNLDKCFEKVVTVLRSGNVYAHHTPDCGVPPECYLVHGHHHTYDTPGMLKERVKYLRDRFRFNCCTDLNNYQPCTMLQLQVNKEALRLPVD